MFIERKHIILRIYTNVYIYTNTCFKYQCFIGILSHRIFAFLKGTVYGQYSWVCCFLNLVLRGHGQREPSSSHGRLPPHCTQLPSLQPQEVAESSSSFCQICNIQGNNGCIYVCCNNLKPKMLQRLNNHTHLKYIEK